MSVRFILGRSGTGKTEHCFNAVRDALRQNPAGPPLYFLVPDHMTFDTEYEMAKSPGLEGMTRFNVYSFARLALRVLQQTGGVTRYHLNNVGMTMLLRKIVEQNKEKLRIFKKASEQKGFYDLLHTTVTEFKRYCLTPDDLQAKFKTVEASADSEDKALLKDKLFDMQFIFTELEQALLGKYVDSEDYLKLLAEQIEKTAFIKDADIWIDGFTSMTPQERAVVEKLMCHAKSVTIALTLDKPYEYAPDDLSLFRQTALTYLQLNQLALEHNVPIEQPIIKAGTDSFQTKAIAHLAEHYEKRPFIVSEATDGLNLTEAVNRREEIEQTARDIVRLTRDENMRYRELAVLVRDLSNYYSLIETIFEDYEIPVFIDQKRPMHHHPLIEFIRSALDVINQNWRYEAVFRSIKTDLLFPLDCNIHEQREKMDILENYVIAHGVYGARWKDSKSWLYRRYRGLDGNKGEQSKQELNVQRQINRWRMQVAEPLSDFERKIKAAKTVTDQCTVLYHFLIDLSIPEKMERLRGEAEQTGRLDEAREHDQVWKAVMDTLDQLVEAAGGEPLSLNLFSKVLDTGLDSLNFALVPPALDHVIVGSMDRSHLSRVRAVFILGINEGVVPAKPIEDGIFSDNDREALDDCGLVLADGTREQLLDEEFLIYRSLTGTSEKLYLSYPIASEEGQALLPSPVISRIKKMFPKLSERLAPAEPQDVREDEQLDFIVGPNKTLGRLTSQIRHSQRGYPISDLWWDAYNWYTMKPEWTDKGQRVLSGLFYRNQETLQPETAKTLYGEKIRASVSRMELFNACPFAQFASYGLRLKERDVFRLEAPDIGQLFHSALKLMTEKLQKEKRSWAELSGRECETLALDTVKELAPKLQREILMSSNRHQYLQHKLSQVVARAAKVMRVHAGVSGFSPIGLELPFGPDYQLPPLVFELPNGCQMEIIGRIDRVDKGMNGAGILLRIIDYKSSSTDLSLTDIYFGLALQMLTYLDVVITHAKDWLGVEATPAGVLYFHVHNPMLNATERLSEDELEQKLMKDFKMKGLILADEDIIRSMDQSLDSGHSDILPVGLKRDGSFYKSSSVADTETFQSLRQYVRQVMKKVGTRITEGDVHISPYKLKNKTPCQFCSFKSFCQFDQSQEDNSFRYLKKDKDDIVLGRILESEGGAPDDNTND
ncbi:DNA helicase/exodeoxyribonuclease V subunit B [Scopulibacillus darangshiensis]|uniref:ATP-dependent helicase/deoxyribonuclease subunit B n=1 Tax=Scopulibacillus darangshiensis TaxID=442528 RepID=A0A4R2P556_9BACL|nr:helicase-exonuclease AddAB subunit AddB [Scopulibacillus darangshiensis]TCP29807.1 DNA helicase/exodeoxyribonuclease V subunit B [Scopulibacillus darangshiensis]